MIVAKNMSVLHTGTPTGTKMYYLSLTFINRGSKVALIKWTELQDKAMEVELQPNSQVMKELMFSSTVSPAPIQFTAVEKETNTPINLNAQSVFSVQPKETKEMVTIYIGEGRAILILFIMVV